MARTRAPTTRRVRPPLDHAVNVISQVCDVAASRTYCSDLVAEFKRHGLQQAVRGHDTPTLFDWIVEMISFQGISDGVAEAYLHQHGSVSWIDIGQDFKKHPSCPLLMTHWSFFRCGFDKTSQTCSEPEHLDRCPLPRHALRNGRLNQSAFSVYLFVRDITDGDLVGWIDTQIARAGSCPDQAIKNLFEPLRQVFGVSDKILAMSFSTLLIGAKAVKPKWFAVGSHMLVVDTLVHNFLHRSGILNRLGKSHVYGALCYRPGGCADILRQVSASIDARRFNASSPEYFPRLIQHAIWRYCAEGGLNVCNGNKIDDRDQCRNWRCVAFGLCDREPLKFGK